MYIVFVDKVEICCFRIIKTSCTFLIIPIYFSFDRSHAIFTVWIKVIYTDPGGHKHYRKGKLNLVDLAGSERHGKTGNKNISSAFCLQFY